MVHYCPPQEPGRCEETGAALHCEEWTVVPGGAGRGVDGESAETSAKTGRGLRPEIAEAGPALFGPMDGERLGVQVGLRSTCETDGIKKFQRAKEPSVEKQRWRCDPARRSSGITWGKEERGKLIVEEYVSVRVLDSNDNEYASQVPPLMAVLQEKLTEARAPLGRKRQGRKWLLQVLAERVLDSTADTLVTAELDSRRRKCHTGSSDGMGKRKRGEQRDGSKKKGRSCSSGQTVESCSSDEALGREDESKVRRTAPPGAASRGLRSGGRGASERSGGCLSRYSSEAECGEQAQLQGLRELQSSAEAVDLLMGGRVASAIDVLIQRFRAVEAASLEEGGWSVARHLEVLPEAAVSTMSSGLRVKAEQARLRQRQGHWKRSPREGERGTLRPRSALEERGRRRRTPSRPAKRLGGRKMGEERPPPPPSPLPSWSERTEQGRANQVAVAGEVAPLVVCGAQRASLAEGTAAPKRLHGEVLGLPW